MCWYTMIFHNFWYILIFSQIWFGSIRSQYSWIFGRLRHSPGEIRQNQASFVSLVFFFSNNMYSPVYRAIRTPSGLFHFCVKSLCWKMYSWLDFMMLIFNFAVSFLINLKHIETSFHCELNWTWNAFDWKGVLQSLTLFGCMGDENKIRGSLWKSNGFFK